MVVRGTNQARAMKMRAALPLAVAVSVCLLQAHPAGAQTSDAGRLQQLEETYLSNLRKYHAPVIQDYLAALQKLKESAAERGPGDGFPPIDTEIDRVRKVSATTGVFPY